MRFKKHNKTALIAVLFIFYPLNSIASNSVQCLIKNDSRILDFDNSMVSSFTLSTKNHSTFHQNKKSGTTKLILDINQFPVIIKIHANNNILRINPDCTLSKLK